MGRIFGNRLRAERLSRGLTQEQLGGPECSHSYVSLLERGVREPSMEILGGLARRLGLPPGELEQWALQPTVQDQEYSLAALHAWCAWDVRDYESAASHALVAAQFARESRKDATVCEMNLLRAECLTRLGRHEQGRNLVNLLLANTLTSGNAGLRSEALQLSARMSLAERSFRGAAAQAQEGLTQGAVLSEDSMVRLSALHLVIRTLLGEGHKEAAWRHCELASDDVVPERAPSHLRGRLAWVVGDVAFARGQAERGIERHERAAGLLRPQVDLKEWATFNLGSARARLEAGVADDGTLACLDRAGSAQAILGQDILGSGEEPRRELRLLRASWLHAQGRDAEALDQLAPFEERSQRMDRLSSEAAFLGGRILLGLGAPDDALARLALAQEGFFRLRNLRGAQGVADLILEISRTRYANPSPALAHCAAS
ncbi:transcriptional regulator with XRE-family HTH domain [Arthrobacter woluwensis]|uniref:helix-turn-helix domain-containing protein n=1 Tax=Arthrobacter woluwensis TaxID=156980 RepID=UPI00278A4DA9|nr:helix-turn-helix transcriptional regulator [Arthrobacter woluwensis]MDQ0710525.1 transcriptional regulator with XRE-family HTH domain [Arthrobacter woluwensis]